MLLLFSCINVYNKTPKYLYFYVANIKFFMFLKDAAEELSSPCFCWYWMFYQRLFSLIQFSVWFFIYTVICISKQLFDSNLILRDPRNWICSFYDLTFILQVNLHGLLKWESSDLDYGNTWEINMHFIYFNYVSCLFSLKSINHIQKNL